MVDSKAVSFFKRYYIVLTPILIFISFPSYDLPGLREASFCAWFAFVPLFYFIRNKALKSVYIWTFLLGIIMNYLTFGWIGHFGASVPGGKYFLQFLLTPAMSVVLGLQVLSAEYLSRKNERFRLLIYPAVWIIIDWIQVLGYITMPWVYLAYTQYSFTSFIQLSSYTGVHGVTFVLILSNIIITELIIQRKNLSLRNLFKNRLIQYASGLVAFVILFSLVHSVIINMDNEEIKKKGKSLRVSLIQSCISPWVSWSDNKFEYLEELKLLTEQSLEYKPELVIWSESATLETISYDYSRGDLSRFEKELLDFTKKIKVHLLTGEIGVVEEKKGFYIHRYPQNNAALISPEGKVLEKYSKIQLVPFGEWFPYKKWLPIVSDIAMRFGASNFVPGSELVRFKIKGLSFAPLICYEGMFFRLCRDFRNSGADFFVNITNDGWTHTFSGHMQHFAVSVFRAIENGVYFIRSGNTGYSTVIDPYGKITASIPILKPGYLEATIYPEKNRSTLYTYLGDYIIALAFFFCLYICLSIIWAKSIYSKSSKE